MFSKLEKDSPACARKFCFTNGARAFNQNNLKLPIDNYNKSTGGNNINDDNDNNGNSYVLSGTLLKALCGSSPAILLNMLIQKRMLREVKKCAHSHKANSVPRI